MTSKLLTDTEAELMAALWTMGEGSVREVMAQLPPDRAYTTVSTILRILEKKGFLAAHKEGRSHIYKPTLSRAAYQRRQLRHLVGGLFGGDPLGLVRTLIDGEQLQEGELADLRALIDEKLGGEE